MVRQAKASVSPKLPVCYREGGRGKRTTAYLSETGSEDDGITIWGWKSWEGYNMLKSHESMV